MQWNYLYNYVEYVPENAVYIRNYKKIYIIDSKG